MELNPNRNKDQYLLVLDLDVKRRRVEKGLRGVAWSAGCRRFPRPNPATDQRYGMVSCLLQTQPLTTALLAINTVPSASGCGQLVKVVKNASKKMNKKYFDVCDSEGCNRLAIVFIS